MSETCRRKRLFCWLLSGLVLGVTLQALADGPATTTVSDVVYRADGLPAGGTLLISWPTFTTAAGSAVTAGTKTVMLGTQGALSVALAANAGASPAGTLYSVVFQLNDNSVPARYSRYTAALHLDYPL